MTGRIAWKNLAHDRVRLGVTLIGIVFSVVLMGMQLGLLLNFIRTTATMVDHAGADIWITGPGVRTVDIATPIEERRRFQALAVEGVARAETIILEFSMWKRPDGVRESVILVGLAPDATMGLPWAMTEERGVGDALATPDGVIIDRLYAKKLGSDRIGDKIEINDRRARVAGFTHRVRTFTQSPYVHTAIKTAREFNNRKDDHASYVLIKVAPGHDPAAVAARLRQRIHDVDVRLAAELSAASSHYWLFTTGAGVSLIMSGILGLLVGGVIVAQTLYASTMDHLGEYATLRAMGGPSGYLNRIVLGQAAIAGTLGYALGIAIVIALVRLSRDSNASPQMPWWLAVAIGGVTLTTCLIASLVSLRKVTAIDPTKVFR